MGKLIKNCGNALLRKRISEVSSGFTRFEKDDVIVAKITPCFENSKGALLDDLVTDFGYGSTEFHVLRANESISPRFLFYITKIHSFMQTGEASMSGSAGQKRVPSSFVENFFLGSPPFTEQTAIANYLDEKTAQIDTLIEKKQKLIELLKEERTAIINHAVTKGINPKAKLKPSGLSAVTNAAQAGIEWLGDIPEHWEVKKLKYVAILKSGEGITADSIRDEGEYPVFGGNGVRGYTSSYSHEGDFVIIGRQGALCGNINYAKGKFWASEHAVVATPIETYNLIWFGELLRTMNLNQYSQSAAQPGLAVENVRNLFVPVPSFNEQTKIAQHVQTHTTRIATTISKIEREIGLLQEYRTALISEVVTGKIKVI